jgi:hypothetical protein
MIYAVVIPPWQAPDEPGHFEFTWLIAQLGRIPKEADISSAFEQELLASLYEWRYGDLIGRPLPAKMPLRMDDLPLQIFARRARTILSERFSLAYAWQALFILPFLHQDLAFQLFAVRFSSVWLNVGIVWLAYCMFQKLVPSRPSLSALMTSLMVFLPQHTFINSAVGDGPMAEWMACLVLYSWVCLFQKGFGIWRVVGIVLGTLAAVWSKRTTIFLVPVDVGLAFGWFLRQRHRFWTWSRVLYVCAGLVLLSLVLWGWSRSSLGVPTLRSLNRFLAFPELVWVDERGISFGSALLLMCDSFWANFGWMTLAVSERWYGAVMALTLLSLIGWGTKGDAHVPRWGIGIMATSLLTATLFFIVGGLLLQPFYWLQGRYLFPVTASYAFLFVGGLERLFARRYGHFAVLFLLFLVLFDVFCIVEYVLPYFYS